MKYKLIQSVSVLLSIALLLTTAFLFRDDKADLHLLQPVWKTDNSLHLANGLYYYNNMLFTGIIQDSFTTGGLHERAFYRAGKQDGETCRYFPDGNLSEKRYYSMGEKSGVHVGWWPNGRRRFEYHFNNGVYDGLYAEWYTSGQAYKQIFYKDGTDQYGKGWRESGKLYMNYSMLNGRRYGIVNSNLCYTIKRETGLFASDDNPQQR